MESYQDKLGWHRHRCRECGMIWEHSDEWSLRPENAHECPGCGQYELCRYDGDCAPEVTQTVEVGHADQL